MNTRLSLMTLLCVLGAALQMECTQDTLSPRFGIVQITLPGGRALYLKRQVRGLSYDELAISPDGNRCIPASPETDYIFDELGAGEFPVFYSASQNVLTVYHHMSLKAPKHAMQGVSVITERLSDVEYDELSKTAASKGISRTSVEIGDKAYCP